METTPLCILPARGGSKRIPRKNIRPFAGRPALAWPLAAARASGLFARLIVSTDDTEIAATARAEGAETPFLRDPFLADDHAGTTEVIRDAVARLALPPDTPVCCLYPTALFVTPEDLREGHTRLTAGARWVLGLGRYRTPIDRAYALDAEGRATARTPSAMEKRSQDLAPAYYDAGAFYWARAATWADPAARVWDGAAAVVIPEARALDIDTPEDWAEAEARAARLGLIHAPDDPR